MMNHDPVLSEKGREIWLSCLHVVFLKTIIFFLQGKLLRMSQICFSLFFDVPTSR